VNQRLLRDYAKKMTERSGSPASCEDAEAEILECILETARNFRRAYRFGYHEEEDMEQQTIVFCLEALEKYDPAQPLENFLVINARNRLLNLRRDKWLRAEAPCSCCDTWGNPETPCSKHLEWVRNNTAKMSMTAPLDIGAIVVAGDAEPRMAIDSDIPGDAAFGEILARIDACLPTSLRGDYLRMRSGRKLPRDRREAVQAAALELVGDDLGIADAA
jgi:hypothetical protein